MKTYTLKLDSNRINKLKNDYKHFETRYDIQHTLFQIKGSDFTITAYKSGKVVIQGEGALFHVKAIDGTTNLETTQSTISTNKTKILFPMAGSDEVGTGDYFGPITVCAVFITKENLSLIPTDAIMDSKLIKDDKIREIAPILMDTLEYSLLVLENRKYNKVHNTYNMNSIKALLHNKAYLNLSQKVSLPKLCVVDQFMPKTAYFKALSNEKEIVDNLTFETKAESKYIAVACASIIARYAFLDYLDKLSTKFNFDFPKGAGSHVDIAGAKFVNSYGIEALNDVAKVHFANTEKIKNLL